MKFLQNNYSSVIIKKRKRGCPILKLICCDSKAKDAISYVKLISIFNYTRKLT